MSAKHTPGPWRTSEFFSGLRSLIKGPHGMQIALCQRYEEWTVETVEANARLISAAPDLLEALQAARGIVQLDRDSIVESESCPVTGKVSDLAGGIIDEYDTALAKIDSAIAKATGADHA